MRNRRNEENHEQLEIALLFKAVKILCKIEERLDEICEHIEACRECIEEEALEGYEEEEEEGEEDECICDEDHDEDEEDEDEEHEHECTCE